MKQLIIVGCGGMGRSVYSIAQGCIGYNEDFIVKGFLDDDIHSLDGFNGYPPVLGTIGGYSIQEEDVFVCSIGNVVTKMRICECLKAKGAIFYSLIHRFSFIHQNAEIGVGCIVAEYAGIGADCRIGENCLIQSFACVAHDCLIGNYVRIDTHATCVGGVIVKDCATIHTGAILNHKVVVEDNATVGAASFVIKKVKKGITVFGNPAKPII